MTRIRWWWDCSTRPSRWAVTWMSIGYLLYQVYDRSTLKLVRALWGHDDHVWSIDMNKEFIVSNIQQ